MKKSKFTVLIAILAVLVLILTVFAACEPTVPGNGTPDFTVKVVGVDGTPYTEVQVQPCLADGTLCFSIFKKVDSNGIATFNVSELGEDYADVTALEIHLVGLPEYLTYDKLQVSKGNSVTITIKMNVKTPTAGNGTAQYAEDQLSPGTFTNQLDTNTNFSPYQVGEGVYEFKFASADQKIYFQFQGDNYPTNYVVYSVGEVDANITWLQGSKDSGIRKLSGDGFYNDNVSDSDKNFRLNFVHDQPLIDMTGSKTWFELALSDEQDVNKTGYISFEYVSEYIEQKGPETTDVMPKDELETFSDISGNWIDADLDGSFKYAMGNDGYYHVGEDATGPVLCAAVNKNPRGYDATFEGMYENAQKFVVSDGKTYSNDYYPLIHAYAAKANSDGMYGVTEELKGFLDVFVNRISGTKSYLESIGGLDLPDGEEWLWACGYYEPLPTGEKNDPISVYGPIVEVEIPSNSTLWYAFNSHFAGNWAISYNNPNVSMTWYGNDRDTNGTSVQGGALGVKYEFSTEGDVCYFTLANATDGDITLEIEVSEAAKQGTIDNPVELNDESIIGEFSASVSDDGYHYTYTPSANISLIFTADADTKVTIRYYDDAYVNHDKDVEPGQTETVELEQGVSYLIIVSNENGGSEFSFSVTAAADAANTTATYQIAIVKHN